MSHWFSDNNKVEAAGIMRAETVFGPEWREYSVRPTRVVKEVRLCHNNIWMYWASAGMNGLGITVGFGREGKIVMNDPTPSLAAQVLFNSEGEVHQMTFRNDNKYHNPFEIIPTVILFFRNAWTTAAWATPNGESNTETYPKVLRKIRNIKYELGMGDEPITPWDVEKIAGNLYRKSVLPTLCDSSNKMIC